MSHAQVTIKSGVAIWRDGLELFIVFWFGGVSVGVGNRLIKRRNSVTPCAINLASLHIGATIMT